MALVERLYLDTNQWNHLVQHVDFSPGTLSQARVDLRRAVGDGQFEVVGSLPLLQEVVETYPALPDKYEAMCAEMFEVIAHRWLKPLDQRHVAEANNAGLLSDPNRYLSRDIRRKLTALARRRADIEWIAERTHEEVTRATEEQDRLKPQVLAELAKHGDHTAQGIRAWWADVDIDDLVRDVVAEGVRRKLVPDGVQPIRDAVPSAWLFTAFKMARLARSLGEGRAIKRGDYMDAEHAAAGAYFDVLVTDDQELRETCVLLDPPFTIEGFKELLVRIGTTLSPP
jgi:hypothetical protein